MNSQSDKNLSHDSLNELITDIEQSHHVFTRTELNRIADLLDDIKLKSLPIAHKFEHYFMELQADLLPHLMKEEHILFPYIRELEKDPKHLPGSCFGSVSNPIRMMKTEHVNVMYLLEKLRELTANYTPTPDTDADVSALYSAMARLDADLEEHIRREDSVLFPRAIQLESEMTAQTEAI